MQNSWARKTEDISFTESGTGKIEEPVRSAIRQQVSRLASHIYQPVNK